MKKTFVMVAVIGIAILTQMEHSSRAADIRTINYINKTHLVSPKTINKLHKFSDKANDIIWFFNKY